MGETGDTSILPLILLVAFIQANHSGMRQRNKDKKKAAHEVLSISSVILQSHNRN
jgi:hypothetical protein